MAYKKIEVVLAEKLELVYCTLCGAIVFDGKVHDEWHEREANNDS